MPSTLDTAPVRCPDKLAIRLCHDCPSSCSLVLACSACWSIVIYWVWLAQVFWYGNAQHVSGILLG